MSLKRIFCHTWPTLPKNLGVVSEEDIEEIERRKQDQSNVNLMADYSWNPKIDGDTNSGKWT